MGPQDDYTTEDRNRRGIHHWPLVCWLSPIHTRSAISDGNGSICLTRIVQLVDTIRLDFKDPTWSNIDVAIWNIIESHIGVVAANLPLMGPLVNLFARRLHLSVKTASSNHRGSQGQKLPKYELGSLDTLEHGFKGTENDDSSGAARLVVVASSITQQGSSDLGDEIYDMDHFGPQGIRVRTDLEQNYSSPMRRPEVGT